MQKRLYYIKDACDFIRKINNLTDIPEDAIFVIADVVRLYPSKPH